MQENQCKNIRKLPLKKKKKTLRFVKKKKKKGFRIANPFDTTLSMIS